MIKFPQWVQGKRGDCAEALASRRLRFLVLHASLQLTEKGGVASLADFADVPRELLHWSIKHGAFSVPTATKLETVCGREVLRKEWLIFPNDIPSE